MESHIPVITDSTWTTFWRPTRSQKRCEDKFWRGYCHGWPVDPRPSWLWTNRVSRFPGRRPETNESWRRPLCERQGSNQRIDLCNETLSNETWMKAEGPETFAPLESRFHLDGGSIFCLKLYSCWDYRSSSAALFLSGCRLRPTTQQHRQPIGWGHTQQVIRGMSSGDGACGDLDWSELKGRVWCLVYEDPGWFDLLSWIIRLCSFHAKVGINSWISKSNLIRSPASFSVLLVLKPLWSSSGLFGSSILSRLYGWLCEHLQRSRSGSTKRYKSELEAGSWQNYLLNPP